LVIAGLQTPQREGEKSTIAALSGQFSIKKKGNEKKR